MPGDGVGAQTCHRSCTASPRSWAAPSWPRAGSWVGAGRRPCRRVCWLASPHRSLVQATWAAPWRTRRAPTRKSASKSLWTTALNTTSCAMPSTCPPVGQLTAFPCVRARERVWFVSLLTLPHGLSLSNSCVPGYSCVDAADGKGFGARCVFTWNKRRVPEPKAMFAHFRQHGMHVLPNIKPWLLKVSVRPPIARLAFPSIRPFPHGCRLPRLALNSLGWT